MSELLTDALALLESSGWLSLPFWAKALSGSVAGYLAWRVASDVCRVGRRVLAWTGAPAAARAWWHKPPAWQGELAELRREVAALTALMPSGSFTATNAPPRRAG